MKNYILNSGALKNRRRELRINQTPAEKLMWEYLRARKLGGYRFVRQYSIGPYILDFYCPAAKLTIELDGGQHLVLTGKIYDKERDTYLDGFGVKTMRFLNQDVMNNTELILQKIFRSLSYL